MKKRDIIIGIIVLIALVVLISSCALEGITGYAVFWGGERNCSDSDGGLNYYEQGIVTISYKFGNSFKINKYTDRCYGKKRYVKEYYCDSRNRARYKWYRCSEGCEGGACISNETITCYNDADCPPVTARYCSNNSEACSFITIYRCKNPGTPWSECVKAGGSGGCQYCKYGCENGVCKKEGATSLFKFSPDGSYSVMAEVPIKDGDTKINILYGDGKKFVGAGKSNYKLLRTSTTNKIVFDLDTDEYFVASKSGASYLLSVESIVEDSSVKKNYTTIRNSVTGEVICSDKAEGDTCIIEGLELIIGRANKNEKWVELGIESGGSFNKLYDKNGNYIFLPLTNLIVPLSGVPQVVEEYIVGVYDSSGKLIEEYKAYWVDGKVAVKKVEEKCDVKDTLRLNEEKTYGNYKVKLIYVDANGAQFSVERKETAVTKKLGEGDDYKFNIINGNIRVTKINYQSFVGGVKSVEFCLNY